MSFFLQKPLATPRYDLDEINSGLLLHLKNKQLPIGYTVHAPGKHGRLTGTGPYNVYMAATSMHTSTKICCVTQTRL